MSSLLAMHGVPHLGISAMHTSHAQLARAPVSMHQTDILGQQSVISAIDGVGVGALRTKSIAADTSNAPKMSDAVRRPETAAVALLRLLTCLARLTKQWLDFSGVLTHCAPRTGVAPPSSGAGSRKDAGTGAAGAAG